MNEQSRQALDAYYSDAASWNADRLKSLRSSQRLAWWIAGAAVIVAVLEALSLALLTPLKTIVPYTLLVDRTTGYVQALKPNEAPSVAADTALTQSLLAQYVTARESFDLATVNTAYRKVALLSVDRARSGYLAGMQAYNPTSPIAAYPRGTVIETRVKSVSPIGPDVALVRFENSRIDPSGGVQPPIPWVAVIRYRYSAAPMKLEDRFINPLGFQVVSYRRDAEALAPLPAQERDASAVVPIPRPIERNGAIATIPSPALAVTAR